MSFLKRNLLNLLDIVHSLKDDHMQWRQANQDNLAQLKHNDRLHKQNLKAQLEKRRIQIDHEIASIKAANQVDLTMLKIKHKQDLKDYKQYLNSLEELKSSIQKSYPHLPTPMAYTIHNHAKELLNLMWEENDLQNKRTLEMELIQYMHTLYEDAQQYLNDRQPATLPTATMRLLENKSKLERQGT